MKHIDRVPTLCSNTIIPNLSIDTDWSALDTNRCNPGNGCRKFIPPDKFDGVNAFTMMLNSVTVIGVANRKGIFVWSGSN